MFALTDAPIDDAAVRRAVETPSAGAVVVFHGTVPVASRAAAKKRTSTRAGLTGAWPPQERASPCAASG